MENCSNSDIPGGMSSEAVGCAGMQRLLPGGPPVGVRDGVVYTRQIFSSQRHYKGKRKHLSDRGLEMNGRRGAIVEEPCQYQPCVWARYNSILKRGEDLGARSVHGYQKQNTMCPG